MNSCGEVWSMGEIEINSTTCGTGVQVYTCPHIHEHIFM